MKSQSFHHSKTMKAQGIVEFALILPLLLLLILGIVEMGRMLLIYSSALTASREAARYGSAAGNVGNYVPHYQDCAGIRQAAERVGSWGGVVAANVVIQYDHGPNTTVFAAACPSNQPVSLGDRIIVSVSSNYQPILPLVNVSSFPISSSTSRTILKDVSVVGTPAAPYPTNTDIPTITPTPTETGTPTITPTPSDTPTASPSPTITQTPTPGGSPTPTPTETPTPTLTPTHTPTPSPTFTNTPTPTPGCPQGAIIAVVSSNKKKLTWTITNPSWQVPVGVMEIYVEWPSTGNNPLKSITFIGVDETPPTGQTWYPPSIVRYPNWYGSFSGPQEDLVLTFNSQLENGNYHIEMLFDRAYCQRITLDYNYVK
jgi:Flp pilus assembly protein TadG